MGSISAVLGTSQSNIVKLSSVISYNVMLILHSYCYYYVTIMRGVMSVLKYVTPTHSLRVYPKSHDSGDLESASLYLNTVYMTYNMHTINSCKCSISM